MGLGLMTLQIRPMTLDDVDAVMAIERVTYTQPWTEGVLRDELAANHRIYLVAEHASFKAIHEDWATFRKASSNRGESGTRRSFCPFPDRILSCFLVESISGIVSFMELRIRANKPNAGAVRT